MLYLLCGMITFFPGWIWTLHSKSSDHTLVKAFLNVYCLKLFLCVLWLWMHHYDDKYPSCWWVLVGERSNIALNLVCRKDVEWCFVCSQKFTHSHSTVNRCIFMVEQLFCQITLFWPFFLWTGPSEISNVLASSQIVILLFLRPSFFTPSTFTSLLLSRCPMRLVLLSEIPSLLNLENHSKTCVLSVFYSPKWLQMFL